MARKKNRKSKKSSRKNLTPIGNADSGRAGDQGLRAHYRSFGSDSSAWTSNVAPNLVPVSATYLNNTQKRQDLIRGLLPLTDRNLQTLIEQNGTLGGKSRFGGVALDMDQFARQQQQLRGEYGGPNADEALYVYSTGLNRRLLLEFGELNPLLDHLSDLTLLDDVCFPDYYEVLMDAGSVAMEHAWPDLSVLEEFIVDEMGDVDSHDSDSHDKDDVHHHDKHQGTHDQDTDHTDSDNAVGVNFRYPVARRVQDDGILPTDECAPLLDGAELLRVRPRAIQPWEKSQHVPRVHKDELVRFTYFREDIEGTIHAATLGGLIEDERGLVGDRLERLFRPPHYGRDLVRDETPAPNDGGSGGVGGASGSSSAGTGGAAGAAGANLGSSVGAAIGATVGATVGANVGGNGISAGNVSTAGTGGAGTHTAGPIGTAGSAAALTPTMPSGYQVNAGILVNGTRTPKGSPMPASVQSGAASTVVANSTVIHHTPPFWLDVLDPLEEEMKVLSKTFGLHPLTTEDIFLGETREKVELFRQYYFICFTSFDIVYERRKQRAKENEKKLSKMLEYADSDPGVWGRIHHMFSRDTHLLSRVSLVQSKSNRARSGELCPLNMYMIIFKHGVLTFHFSATPHPINVRRRARMLKDHLTVSTDWICYALIDDITDSFAPMIDSIETEVYLIEDEIMKMHSGDLDLDLEDLGLDDLDAESDTRPMPKRNATSDVFYRRQRSKSIVEPPTQLQMFRRKRGSRTDYSLASGHSRSLDLSSNKSTLSKIVAWKRKGDMLRRIGECRKRVMSVMRLLGSKADVIKGFSKRFNENETISPSETPAHNARLALRQNILMYLGDIQDHIVTMVQSLNHYEKLLARSHSNYLAQINIDMTKVNNDMNDVLGKITILGTIVLPINVVTGLWGMNCIVPGQDHEGLVWFYGILLGISMFSVISYIYAKKVTGL